MDSQPPFDEVSRRLSDSQSLVITGIIVGIAGGGTAYFFERMINWISLHTESGLGSMRWGWRIPLTIFIPAAGALIAGVLAERFAPEALGHGADQVNRALGEGRGVIKGHIGWVKFVASAFTIGSGGSAGREGPVIQIGAAVGSKLGQWRKVPADQLPILAAAGAAGGLASAFSIPLASVFFIMEVLLRNFANEAFPAVVIASITGTVTARLLAGGVAQWPVLSYSIHLTDYAAFLVVALICASLGVIYQKSLHLFEETFDHWKQLPRWARPAVGGVSVGVMALGLPGVRGTGMEMITAAMNGQTFGWKMGLYAAAKILATSLTLGSGGSGGTLMPAMFVGSMTGGAIGKAMAIVFPWFTLSSGALAVAGLSCVVTAAYDAPITGMVMALEITRDYSLLAPVMFACMVSSIISKPVKRKAPEVAS